MLPEYKKKTNLGVGAFIVGTAIALRLGESHPWYMVFVVLGWLGLIYGCMAYAKGKGYSAYLGLLGILWLLGLIVLALLPDRNKQPDKRGSTNP